MLEADALFIAVLNNAPSFLSYIRVWEVLGRRKNNTLPSIENSRVKCLWIKKNPYLCGVLLKAYKYEKRDI